MEKSKLFVRNKFAEYYQKCSLDIQSPTLIEKREFGFFLFRERVIRHRGFRNIEGVRSILKKMTPSDVFYSSAYYDHPEAEMTGKGWLGADLIFDIDADHIPTQCDKKHDTWICNNCGAAGRGLLPQKCPVCSEQKINERTWSCELCIESTKVETIKLIDFLMKDFGISSKELKAAFSGHRGYHVQVENEEICGLDAMARKEIVDYVEGMGLETGFHGLEERGKGRSRVLVGPDLNDMGWRGRMAKGIYDFLLTFSQEELEKIKLKKKIVDFVTKQRNGLLESWEKKEPLGVLKVESWRKLAQKGIEKQKVKIDTVVTIDVHRLIRFTNTLHGKTGLKKTEVSITGIEEFDPFKSAIAFKKGTVTVFVSEAPQFRLEDEFYGPYKNQEVELPTSAALLLLCKGLARV